MFGLGFGEMLLLGAIALIAVGPKQLPEVARTLGKFLNEMKRMTGDFTKTFTDVSDSTMSTFNDARKSMNDSLAGVNAQYAPPPPHAGDTLAPHAGDTLAPHAGDTLSGYETNPQGSLFVPTDHSKTSSPSKTLEEEQLEFGLTTFGNDEGSSDKTGRSGKDS